VLERSDSLVGLMGRYLKSRIRAATPDRIPMAPNLGLVGGFMGGLFGGGQPGQSPTANMERYADVGWLFSTVSRISQGVGANEWTLYRGTGDDRREVESHPVLDLWEQPNPFYGREEFLETCQQHLDLTGECWWLILRDSRGRPVELWPMRPDRIRPIPHPDEFIQGYLYVIGSERIPLDVDDVIFIRMPHPLNPYRGLGPVQALIYDLESEKYAGQWTRNFFVNNAEPGGVIELDQTMDDTAWERYITRWREQHKGVANAHRIAILEKGKWVDRKYTQRDMQMEQLRRLERDIILGAFGMPLAMLGISESVNRANAEAAEVAFSRWIVRPRLRRFRRALNRRLLPTYGPSDLTFDFRDPTPQDRDRDLLEARDGYATGILTLNESRGLLGYGEVDDGDEFKPTGGGLPFALSAKPPRRSFPVAEFNGLILDAFDTKSVASQRRLIAQSWSDRLATESSALVAYLEQFKGIQTIGDFTKDLPPVAKIEESDVNGYDWDWWSKYSDDTVAELEDLFELSIAEAYPEVEAAQAQVLASRYAQHRGAELLTVTGDANLVAYTRRRVGELVAQTIEEGRSLGELQGALQSDFAFSKDRASLVARTETATALGEGAMQAAIIQDQDEKQWVTQGDELVSVECRANEAAGWIKVGDPFPSGRSTIPQHPNCRCANTYRTAPVSDIDPLEGIGDEAAQAVEESRGTIQIMECPCGYLNRIAARNGLTHCLGCGKPIARVVPEFRCSDCNALLAKDVPKGSKHWCRRCKAERYVIE